MRSGGDHGGRFVKPFVTGRLPAAHIVVVHCGQIVVNQRITVHHFQRHRNAQSLFAFNAEQLRALQNQKRTQAFSARQNGIAHRFDNAFFGRGGNGQQSIQFSRDLGGGFFDGGG